MHSEFYIEMSSKGIKSQTFHKNITLNSLTEQKKTGFLYSTSAHNDAYIVQGFESLKKRALNKNNKKNILHHLENMRLGSRSKEFFEKFSATRNADRKNSKETCNFEKKCNMYGTNYLGNNNTKLASEGKFPIR
jgi:uncharacterized protein YecA (UPF0149 family)